MRNKSIEETIIGMLLIDENLAQTEAPGLSVEDFTDQDYKQTLAVIKKQLEKGNPVDFATVITEVETEQGDKAGRVAQKLANATDDIPSTVNFEYHKEQLKEQRYNREYENILEAGKKKPIKDVIDQLTRLEDGRYINPVRIEQHKAINTLDKISTTAEAQTYGTGLGELDSLLDGGIYNGLYIVGAVSSLGKTTLCLQIADHIAQSGTDVIFIALEMATEQMIRKSLSRHSFINCKNAKDEALTEREIRRGAPAKAKYLDKAKTDYTQYAGNIYYYEGIGNIGIDEISKIVNDHIRGTGNRPVLFVDYLQIIAPIDPRATDKQNIDKAVVELKRISRDNQIPVIAVSSLNRDNYKVKINMTAFKESGAIEYTSDVLIGLQYKGAGTDGFDVDDAMTKSPREIQLKVLKNRSYRTGDIELEYYPAYNTFQEIPTPFR